MIKTALKLLKYCIILAVALNMIGLLAYYGFAYYVEASHDWRNKKAKENAVKLSIDAMHAEPIYWEGFALPVGIHVTLNVGPGLEENTCLAPRTFTLKNTYAQNDIALCKQYKLSAATTQNWSGDFYFNTSVERTFKTDHMMLCNQSIGMPKKDAKDSDLKTPYGVREPTITLSYWQNVAEGKPKGGLSSVELPLPNEPWVQDMKNAEVASRQQFQKESLEAKGFTYCGGADPYIHTVGCYCKPNATPSTSHH